MKWVALVVTALVALSSCGKGKQAETGTAAGAPAPAAPEDPGHEAEGEHHDEAFLRIAPDMLRDLRLTTAKVEARAASEEVVVLGEVRVNEDAYAEVGAPVQARVVRVLARLGQPVRAGQALAELQSVDLGRSRADYQTAAARLELARRALERKRGLAAERIVPLREVQEAEADFAEAEANVRAARATLGAVGTSAAGADASRFTLRSPVSGVVIERDAVRGEVAEPAHTLFRVGDLSRLWLRVQAYERDAVRIRAGSTARVTFPALPGSAFSARVSVVGSQVDPASRTIPVQLVLENPSGLLRPGMSARAAVPVGAVGGTILAVPLAALQRLDEEWCVFVPKTEGVFDVRPVGRGRDLGGEVEIVKGLTAGETVVVEGSFLLKAEAEKARGEGGQHEH